MLEAMKTIGVAKRMISDHDYVGARSKLLELQRQLPSLHSIPQMISACDVLCAAELTLPDGENDWYWILQVGPAASLSQIIAQYNTLIALLEGIKGDVPGATAALELVHDAFAVLSNRTRRLVFDSKRMTSWGVCEHVGSPASSVEKEPDSSPVCQSAVSNSSDPHKVSGRLDSSENADDEAFHIVQLDKEVRSSSANSTPSILKSLPKKEVCNSDNAVVCTFGDDLALENLLPAPRCIQSQRIDGHFHDFNGTREPHVFVVGQIWAAYDEEYLPRRYARINNISRSPFGLDVTWLQPVPSNPHEGRWCEAGLSVVCGSFKHGAEDSLVGHTLLSHLVSYTASPMCDQFEVYPKKHEIWATYKDWNPFEWCDNPDSRKACTLQAIQIMEVCLEQEDASHMIVANLVKVDGFQNIYRRETDKDEEGCFKVPSRCMYRFSHRIPAYAFKGEEISGVAHGMFELDPLAINASYRSSSSYPNYQSPPLSLVPMPNSLKLEWSAEDFASGQVWAVYDGPDHMRRQYVVVKNVVSGIEVSVTLLEPHPIFEEEISWVEEKLSPGCGTFRIGSTITTLHMGKFSHLVDCEQSNKKIYYRIYPRKGEVWAMYANWSSRWKQPDFLGYHCRIVEIMSDFSEDSGLLTASLQEVPGYKTFFQRQLSNGFMLNRVVPRREMLSFSHRVEAFVVPGVEKYGIPGCSWHLEPDALPPLLAN